MEFYTLFFAHVVPLGVSRFVQSVFYSCSSKCVVSRYFLGASKVVLKLFSD
jgi:hypothetical protein